MPAAIPAGLFKIWSAKVAGSYCFYQEKSILILIILLQHPDCQ